VRLLWKILLTLLFVAVAPVAVSGLTSQDIARRALVTSTEEKLSGEARHLAELAESTILEAMDDLTQATALRLDRLTPPELTGALNLIYREDIRRNAVALLDGQTREPVVDLVYQETVGNEKGLVGHEPFGEQAFAAFAEHIPLDEALRAGRAISRPYSDRDRRLPLVALAVRVDGPSTAAGPRPWVIAVEVSLRALNHRFEEAAQEGLTAMLVDLEGRVVLHSDVEIALVRQDVNEYPAALILKDPMAASVGVLDERVSRDKLTAYARAEQLASQAGRTWGVVVERDRQAALSSVDDMAMRSLFWIATALLLAVTLGIALARGIARPIEILSSTVEQFGQGRGDARAPVTSSDEIGRLATRFNTMADTLDEKNRELKSFNEDLQLKVDERTRELKDAQDQLIRSQKAAAVGELGAGVAHEINNPLAAVLGSAQLALLRTDASSPVHQQLKDIEKESLRIKDIVESLLKLSADGGDKRAASTVDLNDVVESALALVARSIITQRIQVKRELTPNLSKVRGVGSDLQQAVMALLLNAKEAMPEGGVLTIRTENVDNKLAKIIIDDTGKGIAEQNLEKVFEPFFTTRAGQGHKGMGLAFVHRVVEEHGARITAESRLGKGSSFRIVFPVTREQLHLK
jgi:two-component system NtrC family sensor kinase